MSDLFTASIYIQSKLIDLIRRDKSEVRAAQSAGCVVFANGHACVMLCDGAGDEGAELMGEYRLAEGFEEAPLTQRQGDMKGWKEMNGVWQEGASDWNDKRGVWSSNLFEESGF